VYFHLFVEKKEEEKTGLIAKLGLDDWKFALPMGLFVGIPALSNEVIIFESQAQLQVAPLNHLVASRRLSSTGGF
jgi:hypothetical protein